MFQPDLLIDFQICFKIMLKFDLAYHNSSILP